MSASECRPRGKRKTQDPCEGCGLHKRLCLCADLPLLQCKTRLSLIIHHRELKRTTNTGRLAVRALVNSEMRVRGLPGAPLDLSDLLLPGYRPVVFFPAEGAVELSEEFVRADARPLHLIVPDGNWRQASKVHSRHPELRDLPRVKISDPNPLRHHLRAETAPEGMATLQAIARAFAIAEGEEAGRKLNEIYERKLHRTLLARGRNVSSLYL